jgi:hypothetical protein
MQDEVGSDLVGGWSGEVNISPNLDQAPDAADQIKEVVASLATLEAAARRAALNVLPKAGRPCGTGILPMEDIIALASVYQCSTGQKPIMGAGAFAQFVEKFLAAVGRGGDTAEDYVVQALKDAGKHARKELRQMSLRQEAVGGSNPPQNS